MTAVPYFDETDGAYLTVEPDPFAEPGPIPTRPSLRTELRGSSRPATGLRRGASPPLPVSSGLRAVLPDGLRRDLYRLGFHRGQLDAAIDRFLVRPFVGAFRWCDRMERRWTDLLAGTGSRESDRVARAPSDEEM